MIPSTIDVADLLQGGAETLAAELSVSFGSRPVLVFDGDIGGWRRFQRLCVSQLQPLLEALAILPSVTVARVRGDLVGSTRALIEACDITMVVGAPGTGDGVDDPPVLVGDDAAVSAAIAAVDTAVRRYGQAAIVAAGVLRASRGAETATALRAEAFAYALLQTGEQFREWVAERREVG